MILQTTILWEKKTTRECSFFGNFLDARLSIVILYSNGFQITAFVWQLPISAPPSFEGIGRTTKKGRSRRTTTTTNTTTSTAYYYYFLFYYFYYKEGEANGGQGAQEVFCQSEERWWSMSMRPFNRCLRNYTPPLSSVYTNSDDQCLKPIWT